MHNLQIEIIIFLKAYMLLSDEEWDKLFNDCPESRSYAQAMWTRMRIMAEGKPPANLKVASTHKALCLTCGTVYDRWPNPSGVDLLRQCFSDKCGGYADTQYEATLLGRVTMYG